MLISLIFGVLLGGISVIFILQNITPITVTFFSWQLDGSLALVLFLAMGAGVFITLLFLLPSLIRDEMAFSRMKGDKQKLEEALAGKYVAQGAVTTSVTTTTTEPAPVVSTGIQS